MLLTDSKKELKKTQIELKNASVGAELEINESKTNSKKDNIGIGTNNIIKVVDKVIYLGQIISVQNRWRERDKKKNQNRME